jgi:hypothetical protein
LLLEKEHASLASSLRLFEFEWAVLKLLVGMDSFTFFDFYFISPLGEGGSKTRLHFF